MPYSHASVDEQVVKMSFDNSNFDSNVNDSIRTLNNLDNKLGSLNKDNFSGLTRNLDNFYNFFTLKGQVMFGILTRIGSEVVNLGIKFKNYLFKGIKDGIGEYETIINSTQTIYQNVKQSGASIGDVNAALDELNDYADKTIYNFGQMTNMIGRFASAGVGLNKSVSTIKGLANAAALVGANTEKAQMAWNAVAKAMSKGKFDLLTWKTLEYSGIAGEQFNELIKEVARVNNVTGKSGQNIDEMIAKYGSLSYTLQEGWLDKNLFNEAMQIMSGALTKEDLLVKGYSESQIEKLLAIADAAEEAATKVKTFRQLMDTLGEAVGSGWAQSFRILVGDLEQAKDLYTRISDVISNFIDNNAKIRNKLFRQIMDESDEESLKGLKTGRESFKQTIENMMAVTKTFLKSIKVGFLNIFPIERISAASRKVLDVVQNFTRAFVLNNKEAKEKVEGITGWDTSTIDNISKSVENLIRFFRGLASAIDVVWMVISQPIKAIVKRVPFLNNFFGNLGDSIGDFVSKLGKFGDKITIFRNALKDTNLIEQAVGYFIDNIDELGERYPILGAILWVFKSIKSVLSSIKNGFKSLNIKPLATIFGAIKFVAEIIWKVLNFIFGIFKSIKNSIDWSFLEGPKNAIIGFLKKLSDYGQGLISFEELTGRIGEKISKVFSTIIGLFNKSGSSNKFADNATKSYSKLGDTVAKTGNKIQTVWDKVKSFFGGIGTFFKNMFANADWSLEGIAKKIGLIGGGVAAAALAIGKLKKTLAKVAVLENFADLLKAGTNVLKAYQREMSSKAILNIAISIAILAGAMVALAFVPYDKMENGLVIFSSFLATLAVTLTPIITALAKFNESIGKARKQLTQFDVLNNLVDQLGKIGKKLARGFEFRMIGKMFKDVAISILIFVGAIAALVLLIKLDGDTVKSALHIIGTLIVTLTVSIAALVFIMEKTAKVSKNTNTIIGTFSSFFKLSGVAKVILAIAAAVLVLVVAIGKMVKMDSEKMRESWTYIMALVGLLGAIAVGVAYFTSKAKDLGKFKKISVSMLGAMAGVAVVLLAMKPLIESLTSDDTGAWIKAIAIFSAVIGEFTAMIVVMMSMAKKIGGGEKSGLIIWQNLQKFGIIMTATIAAIGGILYIISKMGDIPKNTLITIGIISGVLVAFIGLLALTTIVISQCKKTFSSNFATVIEKISLSIAALVTAIGALAAGIGVLIFSLSSLNVSSTDVNKVQANLLDKLAMISEVIIRALPKLKKALYTIGWSVGSMFVSFIAGFVDSVVSTGDEILSMADKFVNLIIDILDKVVDILYNRREDIARIIKRALEFIFAEITAVLNSFFKKKDGTGLFTEEGVAKLLGIGGIAIGGTKIFEKVIDGFNKLALTFKNIKESSKIFSGLKKTFKECIAVMSTDELEFGNKIKLVNNLLVSKIANLSGVKAAGNGVAKILSKISGQQIKFDPNAPVSLKKTAIALAAVAAAAVTVKLTFEAMSQMSGKTAQKIRTDVNDFTDILTDSTALWQSIIYGFVAVVNTIVTYSFLPITDMIKKINQWASNFTNRYADMYEKLGKKDIADALREKAKEYETTAIALGEANKNPWDIESLFPDNYEIQNLSEEAYNDGKYISDNLTAGARDGLSGFGSMLNEHLTGESQEAVENLKDYFQINSPSKLLEEIYRYVAMGGIQGLMDKEGDLQSYLIQVNKNATNLLQAGAKEASAAWSDALLNVGLTQQEIDDLFNEKRFRKYTFNVENQATGKIEEIELNKEYLELLNQQKDAIKGLTREEAVRNLVILKGWDITRERSSFTDEEYARYKQDVSDAIHVVDAALTQQFDKTTVLAQGITDLYNQSIYSLQDVAGKAVAATDLAASDIMNSYAEMTSIAKDHTEEMIGMKEAEVQAFLEQEGIERGMSAKAAADASRLITATLFKASEANTEISRQELENKLGMFQTEYENFLKLQQAELSIAAAYSKAKEEAEKAKGDYDEKAVNYSGYERAKWEMSDEAKRLQKNVTYWKDSVSFWEGKLTDVQNEMVAEIQGISYDAGLEGDNFEQFWSSYYDTAVNALGKVESNKRGSFKGVLDSFLSMLGINNASTPDLSYWDIGEEVKDSATLTDNDINTAVGAASDLKDGLESQRADLTPTFDLDQLASDAQKANGIVMSSLMAAQNASIGDYINQDSELNPFMKDRWQNVYNFTQNNYSPKALSRIDIYRQTQRQLSMSRGF